MRGEGDHVNAGLPRSAAILFLVLARVLHQGSRWSAVRWVQTQAVAEVLGLERFSEDDLSGSSADSVGWRTDRSGPRPSVGCAPF